MQGLTCAPYYLATANRSPAVRAGKTNALRQQHLQTNQQKLEIMVADLVAALMTLLAGRGWRGWRDRCGKTTF